VVDFQIKLQNANEDKNKRVVATNKPFFEFEAIFKQTFSTN
jgi:hypothetical protein